MRLLILIRSFRFCCLAVAVGLLFGCAAGQGAFRDGVEALSQQSYDQAVSSFMEATEKNPDSYEYRLKLEYARDKAALVHKDLGDGFFNRENYLRAQTEYQLAFELDPSNFAAEERLKVASRYLQAQKLTADAENLMQARRNLQAKGFVNQALAIVDDYQPALKLKQQLANAQSTMIDGVELEVTSNEPISLNFTEAKLPDVFDIITNLSGINFILDEDVRGNNTTLYLEKATFAQALELLLRMNKLDKKILNSKTIILFPKTRDKQKQFEDQLIHTFYLSNIDAKKAVNLLRTMLQVRKIYVHEELNAIIIRDKADVIKLASKILEANDRSNSEVVFDLELIEVNHTDNRELGLKLSNYSVGAGLGIQSVGKITSSGLKAGDDIANLLAGGDGFKQLTPFYAIPTATFRMMKTQVDAEVLASPKIRVKNKEKAKVHIGSREPVITVTINGDQTSENVQYVDVGVKLDVEPTIQLDDTIVTKLGLEVSNVSGRETTSNGTAVLTISTTNANTALTLKDGEQTIIGGLIRDDKSTTKNKIPFLGDIPLIGELFTGTDKTDIKREILLSITPHIVKSVALPEHAVASIWSGGEDDLKYGRNFGTFADDYVTGQEGMSPQADYQPEPAATAAANLQAAVIEATPATATVPASVAESVAVGAPPQPPVSEPTSPEEKVPVPVTTQTEVQSSEPIAEVKIPEAAPKVSLVQPRVYARGPELVKVGEPFTLVFVAEEVKDLYSAPLYVQYDEELFEFVGATEGSLLKREGTPTIFTHTVLEGSGRIIVGLKQGAGGKGVSGGGDLFSMSFRAKQAASGVIEPSRTNFRNPRGVRQKIKTDGLTIEARE